MQILINYFVFINDSYENLWKYNKNSHTKATLESIRKT